MRISTRGRYGLQAMVILANHPGDLPVMLKEIAQEADVSEGYLQQLFIGLRSGNLVVGIKGAAPGYLLARPADSISVGDVLRQMESAFTTVDCLADGDCERRDLCVARDVWRGLKDEIDAFVDSVRLSDLAESYHIAHKADSSWNYSI